MSIPTSFLTVRPATPAGGRPGSGDTGDGGTGFGSALEAAVANKAAPAAGAGTTAAETPAGQPVEAREETGTAEMTAEVLLPAAGFGLPVAEQTVAPAGGTGIPAVEAPDLTATLPGGTASGALSETAPAEVPTEVIEPPMAAPATPSLLAAPLSTAGALSPAGAAGPTDIESAAAGGTVPKLVATAVPSESHEPGKAAAETGASPAPSMAAPSTANAAATGAGMAGATTPAPAPAAAVAEAQITAGPAPEAAVGALAAVDAAAVSVDGAEPATPAPAAAQAAPPAAVPAAVPAPQIQGLQAQPVAPAAAPAPAAPPAPLLTQVAQPLFSLHSAAAGDHVMTLSVTPENLGPVTVRAHVSADGIRVELFAPNDAGREALRSILTDLRRDLSGSGLSTSLSLSAQDQPGTGLDGRGGTDQEQPGSGRYGTAPGTAPNGEPDAGPAPLQQAFRPVAHGSVMTLDILA